ncbi:MFS transporter [candidate division WOR-1 bacterium RIFCSPHIGHO2_01_FULL_53_15]|uniref:MFS transporter n=1 Tax=candidate division WOR-1 bacterium RIFCSPHIGHO2_01_FULL_53_15 TaxID=1802564 RepID=A0A1F4PYM9_UNCSA|nr:MAG: MFS transporter [candidate division WOR-1 bacterium RIFCSPHIGHO2_01_FULL_53_15]OGC10682.1 MAG: MFS transporter [candidate division WOR-1 bacterium RIFCSPHIGHO2_02_FULL_53_26]
MEFRFRQTFRALKSRNYRLIFIGSLISFIGTWMQMVAVGWLVYRLTNSPFMLGMVGFISQIPAFAVAPFGGVIADRLDRRKVLLLTQTLSMIQALLLAFFIFTGTITVWHVLVLSFTLGLVTAFDMPTSQAFMIEVVEKKEDLINVIALNSSLVNVGRLVGPAIAGVIIAAYGEGICFLVNGLSYLAIIYTLLIITIKPIGKRPTEMKVLTEIREAVGYAWRFKPIRDILGLLSVMSLVGMPYILLMPVFARDVLHGGPQTLGLLMAASGLGALLAGLYLASRKSVLGLERRAAQAAGLFGAGILVFSFSRSAWLSAFIIFLTGFAMLIQMAGSNTILQLIVDERMRGRVMSLFSMAFLGMAPFGSLLSGIVADRIGAPHTLAICGLLCVLNGVAFAYRLPSLRKQIHPVYSKLGIIPQISTGLQTSAALTRPPETL